MTSVSTDSPVEQAPAAEEPRAGRPRHTARWVAAAVGVVVVGLVALLATRPQASDVVAPSPILGQPAPEVSGPGLDGQPVTLSGLRGRYVLVNFFATWCIPCVQEHPELVKFSNRHDPTEAVVLAVVYDDQPDEVAEFFDKRGGSWPVVDDSGAKVDFGVRGVPESFLVGPDGTVLTRLVGGVTADGLDDLLGQAQGGGS